MDALIYTHQYNTLMHSFFEKFYLNLKHVSMFKLNLLLKNQGITTFQQLNTFKVKK